MELQFFEFFISLILGAVESFNFFRLYKIVFFGYDKWVTVMLSSEGEENMQPRMEIPVEQFQSPIFQLFANALLLTSGDFQKKHFNTMTVSWGSVGRIWERPFVQVVVRPQRYTFQFMEQYDNFTVSAFPEKYKDTLMMLGTKSGRNSDKIQESRLTPIPSHHIGSPGFEEAELIIECKKIYYQDINPKMFLADYIAPMYHNDYHRAYFGEILGIWGVEKYKERKE